MDHNFAILPIFRFRARRFLRSPTLQKLDKHRLSNVIADLLRKKTSAHNGPFVPGPSGRRDKYTR